ncbi:MAG: hypothetical protein Q4A56_07015 [Porphyromonadaceae bacterium]|nr:hypothetical protein [Porphyromonadaceae bacterium]
MSILSAIILLIAGTIIYCFWFFPTEIEIKNNILRRHTDNIIFEKSHLLWDTGANGSSILIDNFKQKKTLIGISIHYDAFKKIKIGKLYFSRNTIINSIFINNFIYTKLDKCEISTEIKKFNYIGILGMNVISNYNWLLDFDKNTLQNIPKTESHKEKHDFKLTYLFKIFPYTSIAIEGIKLKKILIDSGLNTDCVLRADDITQINEIVQPDTVIEQFSNGLFSDSILSKQYIYTNIKINDTIFNTLTITEGEKRLIGAGFFRKFDRVFWDSGNREVKFYRD